MSKIFKAPSPPGQPEPEPGRPRWLRIALYVVIGLAIAGVVLIGFIAPDLLGGWTFALLLLAMIAGYYLVREKD